MAHERLDVRLGPLRAQLDADAAAAGVSPGELLRQAYQVWRLERAGIADEARRVLLDLAAAIEPDEAYDPADDPRREVATAALAQLIGSAPAAEGIATALSELWVRWVLERRG